jgi:hypothetical protein
VNRGGLTPSKVHFQIGRITLYGCNPVQQRQFQRALRTSLAELGADTGLPWAAAEPRAVRHVGVQAGERERWADEAAARVASAVRAAITARADKRVAS